MSRSRIGKPHPWYHVRKFNSSTVCVLPGRKFSRKAQKFELLAKVKKKGCDRLIKQKMWRIGARVSFIITRNFRLKRVAFSNQRALINRATYQVTCERWAYSLSSSRVHLSVRPHGTGTYTCSRLTGVDVLKITLVHYLDSLSYPLFCPICTVYASISRLEIADHLNAKDCKSPILFWRASQIETILLLKLNVIKN